MKTKLFFLLLIFTTNLFAQWVDVGTPSISTNTAIYNEITSNSSNELFLSYNDISNNIFIKKYDGTSWLDVINGPADTNGAAIFPDFELDNLDTPYIAFRDVSAGNKLSVMKYQGTWSYVGNTGFTASFASEPDLELDQNNIPYVIYLDYIIGGLNISKFENNSWTTLPQPPGAATQRWGQLEFDNTNTAHVAMSRLNETNVFSYDGAAWTLVGNAPVITTASNNEVKLRFDSTGTPYLLYSDASNQGKLAVKKFDGSQWIQVGLNGFTADVGTQFDFIIDQADNLFVSFKDASIGNKAAVMTFDGTNWISVGTPGVSQNLANFTSITANSNNEIIMAYSDSSDGFKNTVKKYIPQVGLTNVPDDAFETYLINNGYDSGPLDDTVLTANINTITTLDVTAEPIIDFTGIEDFAALTSLLIGNVNTVSFDVTSNLALEQFGVVNTTNITTVDVSTLNNLNILFLDNNSALTVIDIDNATALVELTSTNNPNVTGVDLSNNTLLDEITILNCGLTTIDVTANTALTNLGVSGNQLVALDVSNQLNLSGLNCDNNLITSLNLMVNISLTKLIANDNALTFLDMRNGTNTLITDFNILNNQDLICVNVDDVTFSDTNWTSKDVQTSYSLDCTLGIENQNTVAIKIFPNPASEIVMVEGVASKNIIFKIVDMQGKLLKRGTLENTSVDVSGLETGVYFLKISEDNLDTVIKFIKE